MFPLPSADPQPPLAQSGMAVHFSAAVTRILAGPEPVLELAVPALGAEDREVLTWRSGELLGGVEVEPITDGIEIASARLYRRLLQRCEGLSLSRIWNYVPAINQPGAEGLENYRLFSRARAAAYESAWGAGFTRQLPAASAVGGPADHLAVVFVAGASAPCAVENPQQIPAYQYPAEYGPRSPSFSRASCLRTAAHEWVFISGTAAIKGHQTVSPGQLGPQIRCTEDNLRLISEACQLGPRLGAEAGWRRQFKVYLRHRRDWPVARAALEGGLLQPGDAVVWLEADICRADLEIEIEATLRRPVRSDELAGG